MVIKSFKMGGNSTWANVVNLSVGSVWPPHEPGGAWEAMSKVSKVYILQLHKTM